jgi:N-methylhydantoinase A
LRIVRVGPESAGAKPGPVCYGLGGTEPTVTDANLVLGYLDPEYFLGGEMKLSVDSARFAIQSAIAKKTGLSIEQAAWTIHERANEDIASAFRLHASEVGVDYRNYSFVSFGGAGPVHAARIAGKLYAKNVVIPPRAGVLSAEGLLSSPLSVDLSQTKRAELSDLRFDVYRTIFEELTKRGSSILVSTGLKKSDLRVARRVDMCYHGQGYDVPVDLKESQATEKEFSSLGALFETAYKSKYSVSGLSNAVEITSFKVTISAPIGEEFQSSARRKGQKLPRKRKLAFDPTSMKFRNFDVVSRYSLGTRDQIAGPALIQEVESTTVVPSGCSAIVDRLGNLQITV